MSNFLAGLLDGAAAVAAFTVVAAAAAAAGDNVQVYILFISRGRRGERLESTAGKR